MQLALKEFWPKYSKIFKSRSVIIFRCVLSAYVQSIIFCGFCFSFLFILVASNKNEKLLSKEGLTGILAITATYFGVAFIFGFLPMGILSLIMRSYRGKNHQRTILYFTSIVMGLIIGCALVFFMGIFGLMFTIPNAMLCVRLTLNKIDKFNMLNRSE